MPDVGVDNRLALGYGSAWHLLRCLGWHRAAFSALIESKLSVSQLDWLDYPCSRDRKNYATGVPVRDSEWTRLDFLDDAKARNGYDDFWPSKGTQQTWDAIGRAKHADQNEWILFEAKAYPGEIGSKGTKASEAGGRPKIRAAFQSTLMSLGYDAQEAAIRAEGWLTGYYQHANRLAALHYLTARKIPARLVFLYFYGDEWPEGQRRPRVKDDWHGTLDNIHAALGLKGTSELERRVVEVFVDVDTRNW